MFRNFFLPAAFIAVGMSHCSLVVLPAYMLSAPAAVMSGR